MGLFLPFLLSGLFSTGCLVKPVDAPVVDPFRMPPCEWCPGNRGIEFGPTAGVRVVAAAPGTVTFSGDVAGTLYVVIGHADRTRTTYGNLAVVSVRRGEYVELAEQVGIGGATTHFGWRDEAGAYLDPTSHIGRLRIRPYLVPTDGTAPREAVRSGVCVL